MNSVLNILKKTSVLLSNLLLVTAVYSQAADPAGTGTFSGQTLPPGVNQHEISDDGWKEIPLEHPFPFYGQTFTNSWMLSNGIVAFMDPTQSGMFGACCNGIDFETQLQQNPNFSAPQFSYMLAPLWTDLRDYNAYDENGDGIEDTGFFSESTPDYTRYLWQNISEYGQPNNLNTFGAEIRPDGSYAFFYDKVNITNHQVWIGSAGAMYGTTGSLEFDQQYFGNGADLSNGNGGMVEFDYNGGAVDCSSPLNDPSCPGYNAAYLEQQCDANQLYDPQCPGYEQAYLDQQCSADPLYDPSCPGYQDAYFNEQCSIDPLYDPGCPGYAEAYFNQECSIDPLYDPYCPGYDQAYLDQQCSTDSLYDPSCPGYEQAYYDQQCSTDPLYDSGCPGYAEAYYDQQCALDPLYDSGCPGYDNAYFDQQCSIDALYDTQCPGYDEAYFVQQCDLDPLYDQGCSGYAEKAQELQFEAQCAADPLSNSDCPGYDLAQAQQQADQLTTTSTLDVNNQSSVVENTVENIQTEPVVQESQEIAQEAGTQDTIEETVLEESAAVSENSETVAQPAEPNELQTTSTAQSTVASNEPTADLLDIVENVLAADRDLVEKSIAETVQTSVSQSRSSNANPGSAQTGAVSQQDTAGPGSLFEMANTASNQLQSNSGSQSIESVGNSNSSGQSLATDSLSNNLAMGGSLSSAISNPGAPLPVLPTVRQPSRDQQQQLDKAESLAEQMSEEELEEIAEQRMASMEDDGGFDQDQTVTVLIMNSQNNINAYYNTVDLQTASSRQQWYLGEEIYKNRTMRDNIGSFYISAGKSEKVLREMIEDQYRRNTNE